MSRPATVKWGVAFAILALLTSIIRNYWELVELYKAVITPCIAKVGETACAAKPSVSSGEVIAEMVIFAIIYLILFGIVIAVWRRSNASRYIYLVGAIFLLIIFSTVWWLPVVYHPEQSNAMLSTHPASYSQGYFNYVKDLRADYSVDMQYLAGDIIFYVLLLLSCFCLFAGSAGRWFSKRSLPVDRDDEPYQ